MVLAVILAFSGKSNQHIDQKRQADCWQRHTHEPPHHPHRVECAADILAVDDTRMRRGFVKRTAILTLNCLEDDLSLSTSGGACVRIAEAASHLSAADRIVNQRTRPPWGF